MKFLLIIYPLFFLIYYYTRKKSIRTKLSNFAIWALFFGSSLASVYLVYTDEAYKNTFYGIVSIAYCCWMFAILLKTNEKVSILEEKEFVGTHPAILRVVTYLVIIVGIPSFFHIVKTIDIASFAGDILTKRHELGQNVEARSFMGYITFFSKSYCFLSLSLAFYYIIFYPQKKIIILLLLVSSLTKVIYGLSHAGRGDVLIYMLVSGILFILLYKKMPSQSVKIFKTLFFIIAGTLIFVFILISAVRFGVGNSFYSGSETTTIESIIRYYGLGFTKFSQEFNAFWMGIDGGASHFPFFVGRTASSLDVADRVNVAFDLNTFSTSIGTLIFDVGAFFTVILIWILYFFAKHIARRPLNIFTLFYATWIYSYLVEAIFYFSDIFTGTRVLSLLVIIFLDLLNSSLVKNINQN